MAFSTVTEWAWPRDSQGNRAPVTFWALGSSQAWSKLYLASQLCDAEMSWHFHQAVWAGFLSLISRRSQLYRNKLPLYFGPASSSYIKLITRTHFTCDSWRFELMLVITMKLEMMGPATSTDLLPHFLSLRSIHTNARSVYLLNVTCPSSRKSFQKKQAFTGQADSWHQSGEKQTHAVFSRSKDKPRLRHLISRLCKPLVSLPLPSIFDSCWRS